MTPPYCFTLIHSPLVSPLTWSLMARQLVAQNVDVLLPPLADDNEILPYWQRHGQAVGAFFKANPRHQPTVLTAHSGAGPLLPVIRAGIDIPVAAYLFVDAGIPVDGYSRLELMGLESLEWAGEFRQFLEAGGQFPQWSDEQLREIVPDPMLRQQLLAEVRSRSLEFFTEPIPVFQGWPDAPCGYIRLSPAYDYPYSEARRRGWVTAEMEAGHFQMLVEPQKVADMMLDVASQLVAPRGESLA
jgi:hypothetical protein